MKNNMFKKMLILSVFALSVLLSKQMFAPFIAVASYHSDDICEYDSLKNYKIEVYKKERYDWKRVVSTDGIFGHEIFSPDGKYFTIINYKPGISGGKAKAIVEIFNTNNFDKSVKKIKVINPEVIKDLEYSEDPGILAKFFDYGKEHFVIRDGKKINIYDIDSWKRIRTIQAENDYPSFEIYENHLALQDGKNIKIFNINSGKMLKIMTVKNDEFSIYMHKQYLALQEGEKIKIFDIRDIRNWKIAKTITVQSDKAHFHVEHKQYFILHDDKIIKLFDARNLKTIKTIIVQNEDFDFNIYEKYFALRDGKTIKIFDTKSWKIVKVIIAKTDAVLIGVHGNYLARVDGNKIKIFDATKNWKKIKTITTDSEIVDMQISSPLKPLFQEFTGEELEERQEFLKKMENWCKH